MILPLLNSSAACRSWCREFKHQSPWYEADAHDPACPCWCRDLVVADCAMYSAGTVPSTSRGCVC